MKFYVLTVFLALSQLLYSQDTNRLLDTDKENSYDKEVNLTFKNTTQKRTAGSIIIIDVEKEVSRDMVGEIAGLINGKAPGLFGAYNTWGTGGAVVLVDGIRQDDFYLNSVNPLEIESIVILKDALSTAMYGTQADKGVILVTTKRGKIGKNKLRVAGKFNTATPRALPKYLSAADYMEKYNEAQLNDGVDPAALRYSQEAIDATRNGTNPARYPDNDFYSDRYIKDQTSGINVFADVTGGNESARYYVNTSWNRNNGWLNTPVGGITDRLNFRGNLDFGINEYMKMSVNAAARLSFNTQPNAGNIWAIASTELPNNYPILWDPDFITNDELRESILSKAILVDGQLLGGNSSFLNNVYGTFTRNGKKKLMQRNVQFNGKLDVDLRFITEGLSASIYAGMNFFNTLFSRQNSQFAVYEPVFDEVEQVVNVYIHGTDKAANRYNTVDDNSDFFRQVSYYGTLNYNKSFEAHDISVTALVYNDILSRADEIQNDVLFHGGISANYMYSDKYVAEFALMGIGSRKLAEDRRIEMAPSFGVGWVLSEEEFLSDHSWINYLKLRASYGITKNDNWSDYFLYKSTFVRGGGFNYENGVLQNLGVSYASVLNDISLQKRRDITLGVDASLLDKKMNVQLGYFNSTSYDNITLMSSTYPEILGYQNMVYNNYNSDRMQGIDLGLNYTFQIASDLSVTAGSNLLFISPKITKREEPVYEGEDRALTREGTATDALWGLKSDGLYSETDFNPDGTLVEGLPVPTFGSVQPGDIKYLDQNSDNIIDEKDIRIIGHRQRTQYSLYLDVSYKNFELYILGLGSVGDHNYRRGDYYRVYGNVKYSEMVNYAYGPNNKDVNALHPRLSTSNVSNNNRNSDYWMYKNNYFTVPTMQLTYNFKETNTFSFLKNSRMYVRADNALVFGKNKKYTEVNVGSAPKTRSFSIGLVTSF